MKFSNVFALTLSVSVLSIIGCGSKTSSYSLLASTQKFSQDVQDNRVDVMWVIDNSGSMLPSQQNLAQNFPSFISNFQSAGFDYNIAVTTTDAFMASPMFASSYNASNPYWEGLPQANKAQFRDGLGTNRSGVRVINPLTPNLHNVFITNIMQGTQGSGDERSLHSMRQALESPLNTGFKREGVFLAVIIVTDEEDFSHNGTVLVENYNYPGIHPVSDYKNFLDTYTNSTGDFRRYSVNSVSIQSLTDPACAGQLHSVSKVPLRVHELVDSTGGKRANLCGNFATELSGLADNIIQLASQFSLGGADPLPSTIRVYVNGVELPKDKWTYIAESNAIQFGEGATPPSGANINVTFDPRTITF
jgi:hypothetical protein